MVNAENFLFCALLVYNARWQQPGAYEDDVNTNSAFKGFGPFFVFLADDKLGIFYKFNYFSVLFRLILI